MTSLIVVCIASIVLALSVYLRNRNNPSHRAFAAAVFSVVLWLLLSYAAEQPEFALVALSLSRLALATAISASGFLLNFALTFPTAEMQRRMSWRLFLASYFVFAFLTAFTPLVISGVVTLDSQTAFSPGASTLSWPRGSSPACSCHSPYWCSSSEAVPAVLEPRSPTYCLA